MNILSNKSITSSFLVFFLLGMLGVTNEISAQENKIYRITDYDVISDGQTLNTKAIQLLIDDVSKKGGGIIVFTKGKYLSGSLVLKSNVELHLQEGAVLLGSTNPYDYDKVYIDGKLSDYIIHGHFQLALLKANKAENIALTGKGTIDGQGLQLALNVDSLHHAGVKTVSYNERRKRPNETARPMLTRFTLCKNVSLKGLKLCGSACWGLTFDLCENLTMDSLSVVMRSYWNNDGMDITDCKDVRVTNCNVNAADDGICLKSYNVGHYNDNVYVADCIIRSSASAVKFGTASHGGFKNVTIENIKVFDTFRSAIAIESVDGGEIENILVNNIVAKNTGNAIFVRLGHRSGEKPGYIKNVSIKNIKVEVPFGRPDIDYDLRGPEVNFFHNTFPASITGIPGHDVENIVLENIEIIYPGRATKGMAYLPLSRLNDVPEAIEDYPEFHMFGELPSYGMYVRHVKDIKFKNVVFKLKEYDFRPAFVFDDVKGIEMNNISLPTLKHEQIVLKDSKNVKLDSGL